MKRKYTRILFTNTLSAFTLLAATLPATAAYNFFDTTLTGTDSKINNSSVIVPSEPVTAANSTTISSFDITTGAISVLYSNDGVIDSLQTNNLNDIVWRNSLVGAVSNSFNIMYYQGNSIPANVVQISNSGIEAASPRLNNRGDLVWEEFTLGAPPKSYYRDSTSGQAFELVSPPFGGAIIRNNRQPRLNDNGNIIWNAFFLLPSLTSISSEIYYSRKGTSIPVAISTLTTPTSYIFASDINDFDQIALARMEPLPNSIFGSCKIQKYDNKGNLLNDVNGIPLPPVADFATCPSGGLAYVYLLNNGNVLYMFPTASNLNELFFYDAATLTTTSLGTNINSVAYNQSCISTA